MKPAEFFQVAELLSVNGGPEAEGCSRSAISRYYYAAFLEARDQLKTQSGLVFKSHEVHENVKRAYYWSDERQVKKVGRLLDDLKKLRSSADYSIEAPLDAAAVGEARSMSQEICAELEAPEFKFSSCVNPTQRMGS